MVNPHCDLPDKVQEWSAFIWDYYEKFSHVRPLKHLDLVDTSPEQLVELSIGQIHALYGLRGLWLENR